MDMEWKAGKSMDNFSAKPETGASETGDIYAGRDIGSGSIVFGSDMNKLVYVAAAAFVLFILIKKK